MWCDVRSEAADGLGERDGSSSAFCTSQRGGAQISAWSRVAEDEGLGLRGRRTSGGIGTRTRPWRSSSVSKAPANSCRWSGRASGSVIGQARRPSSRGRPSRPGRIARQRVDHRATTQPVELRAEARRDGKPPLLVDRVPVLAGEHRVLPLPDGWRRTRGDQPGVEPANARGPLGPFPTSHQLAPLPGIIAVRRGSSRRKSPQVPGGASGHRAPAPRSRRRGRPPTIGRTPATPCPPDTRRPTHAHESHPPAPAPRPRRRAGARRQPGRHRGRGAHDDARPHRVRLPAGHAPAVRPGGGRARHERHRAPARAADHLLAERRRDHQVRAQEEPHPRRHPARAGRGRVQRGAGRHAVVRRRPRAGRRAI